MTVAPESPLAVVLVHGSFHGAWCWDRVVPLLEGEGLVVSVPELPTVGETVAALGTFDDDVAAVAAALDHTGPALVCAHSYGGLVAGALDHPGVQRIALLAALMADDEDDPGAILATTVSPALLAAISFDEQGVASPDLDRAAACFYGDCEPATVAWAKQRLRPQSAEPLGRRMPPPAWRRVSTTYLVCGHDEAILPERQREMAALCNDSRELPTSHSPMLAAPEMVAEILVGLATRGG